jgi:hypothetical protein
MSRLREAREWPYTQNRARKRSIELLKMAAKRQDRALEAVLHQRSPEVSEADMLRVRSWLFEVITLLEEAGQGAPDDMRAAVQLIRELRETAPPDTEPEVSAFLERFED